MPRYTIWTVGGLTPGAALAKVGAQGALMYLVIRKEGEIERIATYVMYGAGISAEGFKGGTSIALGPRSGSDFDSKVEQADLFYGSVTTLETGIQLGIFNAGYSHMIRLTGPAAGTKCSSSNYGLCARISLAVGSRSLLMLKFLGWEYLPQNRTPARKREEPSLFWPDSGMVRR